MGIFFSGSAPIGLILLFSCGVCAEMGNGSKWYAGTIAAEDDIVFLCDKEAQ